MLDPKIHDTKVLQFSSNLKMLILDIKIKGSRLTILHRKVFNPPQTFPGVMGDTTKHFGQIVSFVFTFLEYQKKLKN